LLGFVLANEPTVGDNKFSTIFLVGFDETADLLFSSFVWKPFFNITILALHLGPRQFGYRSLLGVLKDAQLREPKSLRHQQGDKFGKSEIPPNCRVRIQITKSNFFKLI